MGFLEVLKERQMLAQITHPDELTELLKQGSQTAYCGFDPTADSLHVGHLLPIMALAHWQRAGHRVLCIVGGGTGLVGDPTGKTELRQVLTNDIIAANMEAMKKQLSKFLDFSTPARGIMLNNADWLTKLNYIDFLRDIGKHFSVNRMLTAECFKQRLEKGLSFLEFNYMLLQSYDFLHLHRQYQCSLQMGGDDQWSNMLGGMELIRRLGSNKAFCVTTPLLTTTDGRKMGKTEKGAVWLDPQKTSPYEYFQFWRNIDDDMVKSCLLYFTFLPVADIEAACAVGGAAINETKKLLAFECTKIVHGEAEAQKAQETAASLFGAGGMGGNEPQLAIARKEFGEGMNVVDAMVLAGVFASKGEARRMIQQGGLTINGKKVDDPAHRLVLADFGEDLAGCQVRKGKKHYYHLVFS